MRVSDFPSLNQKSSPPTEERIDRPEEAKASDGPHHNQQTIHPEVIDHLVAIGPLATEAADGMTPCCFIARHMT